MSNPTKYPINPVFAARYTARTGFSLDDPDRRVPIRGHDLALMLNGKTPGRENRVDQLLKNRGRDSDKYRARAMAWLTPLGGLLGWPERAQAHDHHPPLLPSPELPTTPGWHDWLVDLVAQFVQLELSQPVFGLGIGGALLMTQVIGIRQRNALLHSTVAGVASRQPDLFP